MAKKKSNASSRYIGFAMSFGLTMAITVYFLYKGGQWLDNRLGTAPAFMAVGVLLAVVTVFKRLITELRTMERMEKDDED